MSKPAGRIDRADLRFQDQGLGWVGQSLGDAPADRAGLPHGQFFEEPGACRWKTDS